MALTLAGGMLAWVIGAAALERAVSSGFLVTLALIAVVLPVLLWLDPRERAMRLKPLEQSRAHLLEALRRRSGK
ncbi:MAG: hypothetical protein V4773_04280 [Verrucomicrobiota bacterium]